MLFFRVDRFAEFLIFENYKVFFFFDPNLASHLDPKSTPNFIPFFFSS